MIVMKEPVRDVAGVSSFNYNRRGSRSPAGDGTVESSKLAAPSRVGRALRLLDFSSLAILFAVSRSWLARWLTIAPLVALGKASLEVFCAHLLFCFAALSLAGDGSLPPWIQAALIATTLIGLYPVARFFVTPPTGALWNKARQPHPAG